MSAMLDESAILSARRLGLSLKERQALIETRNMLAGERIPYASDYGKPGFNMNYEAQRYECGAACCIGGHMSLLMQGVQASGGVFRLTPEEADTASDYVSSKKNSGKKIAALFWPTELSEIESDLAYEWEAITPKMAVRAIDNFLKTGEPNWADAVSAA